MNQNSIIIQKHYKAKIAKMMFRMDTGQKSFSIHDFIIQSVLKFNQSFNLIITVHTERVDLEMFLMRVTHIRLLLLNICCSTMLRNKCWAIFHVTRPIFVAQLCCSTFVAQQKSLNISLIWATNVAQHFANGAVWLVNSSWPITQQLSSPWRRRKMLDEVKRLISLYKSEKGVCLMHFCDHDSETIIIISDRPCHLMHVSNFLIGGINTRRIRPIGLSISLWLLYFIHHLGLVLL